MSRNNDVLRVLPATTVLSTAGSTLNQLTPGQLGVFNANTNVSLSSTTAATAGEFFLALGLGSGSTLTGVRTSAGNSIPVGDRMIHYNYRHYRAPLAQIVEVSDFVVDCDTEYNLRVELRNQEIYKTQGYVQFTRTFSVTSSCCDNCTTSCGTGDRNDIVRKLARSINVNDFSGSSLLTARMLRPDTRAEITEATYAAYITEVNTANNDNPDSIADITDSLILQITTEPAEVSDFGNSVNLIDFNPRQTEVIVTLGENFGCDGATLATTQELEYEEGAGYDIKELEYESLGHIMTTPYRTLPIAGVAKDLPYLAQVGTNYSTFTLSYDAFTQGGWDFMYSNLSTLIALPLNGSNEPEGATELVAILDALLTRSGSRHSQLASDVATTLTNSTTSTSEIDDVDDDGINP